MKIIRLLSKNQNSDDQKNQNKTQNKVILLTQTKYIRNLLARHDMKKCALVVTSMTEIKLKKAFSNYRCHEKQSKRIRFC